MSKIRFSRLFILPILLAVLLSFTSINKQSELERKLSKLSSLEREYLENFFKYTVIASTFGYTLYGDKPISIETYNFRSPRKSIDGIDYMDERHMLNKYRLKEGWETWKKYAHLFTINKFSFISYPLNDDQIEICLINKEAFITVVKENLNDFQQVIGENVTPEKILEGYISGKYLYKIQNHDGLFGILLGFGRENSWKFMKNPKDCSLKLFNNEYPKEIKFVFLPMFKADLNSQETKALEGKYKTQRTLIENKYKNNQFLITSLLKLEE